MNIYYAHHIWKYGTRIEQYELDLINKNFKDCIIFNPNGGLGYTEDSGLKESEIMDICFKAIKNCEIIVFSSINGVVGKGVYDEVLLGKSLGLDIYYINNNQIYYYPSIEFEMIENSDTRRLYASVK